MIKIRFKKTEKGFIDIQNISDYNPNYKYQVVVFKLDTSADPIAKKAKTKADALKTARLYAKKYL